jgi:hypothetical protein
MDAQDVLRDTTSTVLLLLTLSDASRPWSVGELVLEIGDQFSVEDALTRLHSSGLAHRCGEFAWATRAAIMAEEFSL